MQGVRAALPMHYQLYDQPNTNLRCTHQSRGTANHMLAIDLSAAVDVYGEWVDAAEAVAKGEGEGEGMTTTERQYAGEPSRATRKDRNTANDSDGEPEYSGEGIVGDDEDY